MSDTEQILDRHSRAQGWSESTQLELALRYIEEQGAPDAFEDFLVGIAETENAEDGRKHVLEVDGYFFTSQERMFEGVMFLVHITEGVNGDLTIDKVENKPQDANYLKKFRMEPFLREVRDHVQGNIDGLKSVAQARGKTPSGLLDEWERDEPNRARIDLLGEV